MQLYFPKHVFSWTHFLTLKIRTCFFGQFMWNTIFKNVYFALYFPEMFLLFFVYFLQNSISEHFLRTFSSNKQNLLNALQREHFILLFFFFLLFFYLNFLFLLSFKLKKKITHNSIDYRQCKKIQILQ